MEKNWSVSAADVAVFGASHNLQSILVDEMVLPGFRKL